MCGLQVHEFVNTQEDPTNTHLVGLAPPIMSGIRSAFGVPVFAFAISRNSS